MKNKMIVSMYKLDKVIQHNVELNVSDVEKLYQIMITGFQLSSFTHGEELSECHEKVEQFMASLVSEKHDKILERYGISLEMSFEEVMDRFDIHDYKVYSNEEFISKFGHEDARFYMDGKFISKLGREDIRSYLEKYPVNSTLRYRYDNWELVI